MFNTYNAGDTNIKVNAVSGTIVKNYRKSFFIRFSIGSTYEEKLFSSEPKAYNGRWYEPAVVIQSMLIGEKLMVAEVMWKADFDALFEEMKEV